MEKLKRFVNQAASAFSFALESRSYQLDQHGFRTDAANLRADFSALGQDLGRAIKREQADNRSR